jgi:exodeoxyribonuclease III
MSGWADLLCADIGQLGRLRRSSVLLRIAAWNVQAGGGERRRGIVRELTSVLPDVIVLTEWSAVARGADRFETLLADHGFPHQVIADPQAMSAGVLIAARMPLERVEDGFRGDPRRWAHARLLVAGTEVDIVGVYVPSGGGGRIAPKRDFFDAILGFSPELLGGRPCLMLGDFNSDHRDDTGARSSLVGEPRFASLIQLGWRDLYRELHAPGTAASWWSNHGNGYRLDHALASHHWTAHAVRYLIGREHHRYVSTPGQPAAERLSDHALMYVEARPGVDLDTAPAHDTDPESSTTSR